jgi:hypothetical protein
MYRKRAIKWMSDEQKLAQAFSSGLEFAFISKDKFQCTTFAFCKDFLQDAVQAYCIQKKRNIYGFEYDPAIHPPICLEKTRLAIANEDDDYLDHKIPLMMDFLHQIEKTLGISKSLVKQCSNPPLKYIRCGVWIIEGSARWLRSPPMLSLYTLLIRLGIGHQIGTSYEKTLTDISTGKMKAYQDIDRLRLKSAMPGIKKIMKFGDRKLFYNKIELNYPKRIRTNTMHNALGIIGFAENKTKKHMPYWHRLDVL